MQSISASEAGVHTKLDTNILTFIDRDIRLNRLRVGDGEGTGGEEANEAINLGELHIGWEESRYWRKLGIVLEAGSACWLLRFVAGGEKFKYFYYSEGWVRTGSRDLGISIVKTKNAKPHC